MYRAAEAIDLFNRIDEEHRGGLGIIGVAMLMQR